MMKTYKWKLLLSSLLILLPAILGLIFWNSLPPQMATHWGINGAANGWRSGFFAVVLIPLLLLLIHWVCVFFTMKDPKNQGQNRKVFGLVLWIMPVISLFSAGLLYAVAMDKEFSPMVLLHVVLGLMFVIIGNYLPKCKQNYTIGIKIKWTLENEENWNATHRFCGKIWVIGGFLMLLCVFLPENVGILVSIAALVVLVAIPVLYSWRYHKKQVREGTAVITPLPKNKTTATVGLVITTFVLILVTVLMFTGSITVTPGKTSFTIEASYSPDLTVAYDEIDAIEYRGHDEVGSRTYGYASARLLTGSFRNEEFGNYTRYSYTGCDACIVLTSSDGESLVLNAPDEDATVALFEELQAKLP